MILYLDRENLRQERGNQATRLWRPCQIVSIASLNKRCWEGSYTSYKVEGKRRSEFMSVSVLGTPFSPFLRTPPGQLSITEAMPRISFPADSQPSGCFPGSAICSVTLSGVLHPLPCLLDLMTLQLLSICVYVCIGGMHMHMLVRPEVNLGYASS